MEGFIEFWHQSRGYGFVHTADGRSYFAHISSFNPMPVAVPTKGLLVRFDEGRATRGPVALNIRIRHSDPELARLSSLGGGQ